MKRVLVIGAGVAGLVCTRTLLRAGADVTVWERSDGVGGRVRSDMVEGFTLDRGFQVLFTAYPVAQRQLDFARLDLRYFEPGGIIARAGQRQVLSDPARNPGSALPSLLSTVVTPGDKLLTLKLSAEMRAKSVDAIMDSADETTEAFLRHYGFSDRFLENFARPFFGGVFLDDSLRTSAKAFQFDWKMLSEGETAVPAGGMGQISEQLAEELFAAGCINLNTRATKLLWNADGAVEGATNESGAAYRADTVVVATPAPEAARLTGYTMPEGQTATVNVYFAGDESVYPDKKLLLHANRKPFVNNAAQITNVAPEHAPPGRHLLSLTILGVPEGDDATLYARALADIKRMLAGDAKALKALATYRPLALYRLPYSQFAQPPGIYDTLPGNDSHIPGLVFAGEFTAASSFNAAMRSGEKAAALILATD